jgi:hypothetical protein
MARLNEILVESGIARVPDIYTPSELVQINAAMDATFQQRAASGRAYVHADDMQRLGLFGVILSKTMRSLIFSIVPDAVLYHCHAYEIPGLCTKSHIFSESLSGYHRDPDSDYLPNKPTHISIFVYLTPVGHDDGAFEFIPRAPHKWLHASVPTILAMGQPGFSFVWQRGFYHRASPNRGPRRRRLIKISVQPNAYESVHLRNENFLRLLAAVSPGDPETDLLLGRYQGRAAPVLPDSPGSRAEALAPNGTLELSNVELAKVQLREKARQLKRRLKGETRKPELAAYD